MNHQKRILPILAILASTGLISCSDEVVSSGCGNNGACTAGFTCLENQCVCQDENKCQCLGVQCNIGETCSNIAGCMCDTNPGCGSGFVCEVQKSEEDTPADDQPTGDDPKDDPADDTPSEDTPTDEPTDDSPTEDTPQADDNSSKMCLCGGKICGQYEVCNDGQCEPPICKDTCPAGESVCSERGCVCELDSCSCGENTCLKSEACTPEGKCLCNGIVCPESATCVDGLCQQLKCTPECGEGFTCTTSGCKCNDETKCKCNGGDACKDGEVCLADTGCSTVCDKAEGCSCGDNNTCENGEVCSGDNTCLCSGNVCGNNEKCVQGTCITEGITCGNTICPKGASCFNGACTIICGTTICHSVTDICYANGSLPEDCTPAGCFTNNTYACKTGEYCEKTKGENGGCSPEECRGVVCETNQVCTVRKDSVDAETGESSANTAVCIPKACDGMEACPLGMEFDANCICINATPDFNVISYDTYTSEDDNETGHNVQLSVKLSTPPQKNVSVTVTTDDDTEGFISAGNVLLFNPDNYNTPQLITIEGIADNFIDGDQKYQVILAATSEEEKFNFTSKYTLVNEDVDVARVDTQITGNTATTEWGGSVTIHASLASIPKSSVTIKAHSSNTNEGIVSPASITLDEYTWSEGADFVVTGVDDTQIDGDQTYSITFDKTESEDPRFDKLAITAISITNVDDDNSNLLIIPENLEQEEGKVANISVKLKTKPLDNVTVKASIIDDDETEASISPNNGLTFTPDDFDTEQTLTVSFLEDEIKDGDQKWKMKISSASTDNKYANETKALDGKTLDSDETDFVISNCALEVDEGQTVQCDVTLTSNPRYPVTITAVSNSADLDVSSNTVEFSSSDSEWKTTKSFQFTGVDDQLLDNDKTVIVTFTSSSGDPNFNNIAKTRTVRVIDKNTVELTLNEAYERFLSENDPVTNYTIQVKVNSKPTKDVTIKAVSTNTDHVVVNEESLVVSPSNWSLEQWTSFTYHAVDNVILGGNRIANLMFTTSSADNHFNGINLTTPMPIEVADNDAPGIAIAPSVNRVVCDGSDENFITAQLSTKPDADVTFNFDLYDKNGESLTNVSNGIRLEPTSLVFTPDNWNQPQNLRVVSPKSGSLPKQAYYSEVFLKGSPVTEATGYKELSYTSPSSVFALKAFCSKDFGFNGKNSIQGAEEEFILVPGVYRFTVAGAGGGTYPGKLTKPNRGGKGGKSTALFRVNKQRSVFVAVGGAGISCAKGEKCAGWNGGAHGSRTTLDQSHGYGGGGATDIRLGHDLYAKRVIVAGGGGGSTFHANNLDMATGGVGGGINGGNGEKHITNDYANADIRGGGLNGCNNGSSSCAFGTSSKDVEEGYSYDFNGGGGGGWFSGMSGYCKRGVLSTNHSCSGGGGSGYIHGYQASGRDEITAEDGVEYYGEASLVAGGGANDAANGYAKIEVIDVE